MRRALVVAAVLLVGCKGETDAAFDAWQSAACSGDTKAFWGQIDEDAVKDSIAEDNPLVKGKALDELWDEAHDTWNKEAKHGKDSDFCKYEKLGPSKDGVQVVRRPSGGTTKMGFKHGKLVSFSSSK